jgi:hypothetical protein
MQDLRLEEITELVSCALNKTGRLAPWNRLRVRVCEHLIGRGLLEPVQAGTVSNEGQYPDVVPVLNQGASVRLTAAGKAAVRALAVRDYGEYFPVASDIEQAQINCEDAS